MGSSLRLSADSRVSLFVLASTAGQKKPHRRSRHQRWPGGGPGLPQARPETASRSGSRFVRPIPHGGPTPVAGVIALGGRRPVMSAGTWPRLRTPPAAARSPAHAFAEPRAGARLCAFKCGRPRHAGSCLTPHSGMHAARCVQACLGAAMWTGWPAARPSRHAGRGRPSRARCGLNPAGSGRNGRGHEKSGGHTPPREVADPKNRG